MRVWRLGNYQAFVLMGGLYIDRLPHRGPKSWRLIVSPRPVWLPFSERMGFRAGPHVMRLGPLDLAWYGRGW